MKTDNNDDGRHKTTPPPPPQRNPSEQQHIGALSKMVYMQSYAALMSRFLIYFIS